MRNNTIVPSIKQNHMKTKVESFSGFSAIYIVNRICAKPAGTYVELTKLSWVLRISLHVRSMRVEELFTGFTFSVRLVRKFTGPLMLLFPSNCS
jgi:hypothetical protein